MRTENINHERYVSADMPEQKIDEEALRLRREWINQAVECYGEDLVKIQQYVTQRSVA